MRHALTSSQSVRRIARLAGIVAALGVAVVISATPAHAQTRATVKIDFAFVAGNQSMEAGAYDIEVTGGQVILRGGSANASVVMPVITKLGRHDTDADAELVFDKVGGKFLFSEFWYPGADGCLVLNTPTDHGHRVISSSHPQK
jgi:hypothetical protein